MEGPPPTMGYGQNKTVQNASELLYKICRGDIKLVRSLLEANDFQFTEGHEWNIFWSSSSCKSYVYEGLNEHQKINHFPQSFEITRKDRLCVNMAALKENNPSFNFDFLPQTYVLPEQFSDFVHKFNHYSKKIANDPGFS